MVSVAQFSSAVVLEGCQATQILENPSKSLLDLLSFLVRAKLEAQRVI